MLGQPALRFEGWSRQYAASRPTYPNSLLAALSALIVDDRSSSRGGVVDVGSGTGIFTRQLRGVLPDTIPIIGVEPAADMRRLAETTQPAQIGISYVNGTAERLPLQAGTASAVLAATAAHWFDRPAFYREAHRVLVDNGLMAIVEYVRDVEASPAATAVVDFLARYGSRRAYAAPDYVAELQSEAGFGDLACTAEPVTMQLTREAFLALALSSSHARAAIDTLGRATAEQLLLRSVAHLLTGDGRIPYGYNFRMFSVRSRG